MIIMSSPHSLEDHRAHQLQISALIQRNIWKYNLIRTLLTKNTVSEIWISVDRFEHGETHLGQRHMVISKLMIPFNRWNGISNNK